MTPQSNRLAITAVSLASLVLMIWVDYATGHEVLLTAAYLVPVCLCAWYLSARAVILMSLVSGLVTGGMGFVEGHVYSHHVFHYWSSLTCFITSLATGLVLHRLKQTLELQQHTNEDLRHALEELTTSTEEIRKLQNGLQVVCAWTKQIKVGDQWMAPDEFLSSQLHLTLSHGMSPEAVQKVQEELKSLESRPSR